MQEVTAMTCMWIISAPHCFAATADQSKQHAGAKKATASKSAAAGLPYDTKPFDPAVTSLPSGYRGHPFRRIYETAVVVAPKGEFETTAEYQARSKRSIEGLYAFVLEPTSTYNADDE